MKIYGVKSWQNEAADLKPAIYINLAIEQINLSNEWLKNTEESYQTMLVNIDILLMFARRFSQDANLLIKKHEVLEWKDNFNEWFNRCGHKISLSYREGIKKNAKELFDELEIYGHGLPFEI